MRRSIFGRWATALMAGLVLVLLPAVVHAQAFEAEKANFETYDKAMIRGSWYPSKDAKKAPVVMLIHKLGSDRMAPGFDSLAKALQAKGFAVLSFDLRGHGDSKNVKSDFWKINYGRPNLTGIKGANLNKEKIEFSEFSPSYYPHLVNDIAAAKYYLEQKNNAGECNVRDLIIVGAEDGGTLAGLWAMTEWKRARKALINGFLGWDEPEGKDIAGMVFLSLQPVLGSGKMTFRPSTSVTSWFRDTPLREKSGLLFLFGAEDHPGAKFSHSTLDAIQTKKLADKPLFALDIKETNLVGAELIGKGRPTEDLIVRFVTEKLRATSVWSERDLKMNLLMQVSPQYLQ